MKKLLILILLLLSTSAYAGKLELSPYALFPTGDETQQGYGLQGAYVFDTGLYSYLSYDLNPTRYLDHDIGIVNLASVGGGYTKIFSKGKHGFKLFVDGGWYNVHDSDFERTEVTSRKQFIGYKKVRCKKVPQYVTINDVSRTEVTYSGAFGGKCGLGYSFAFNRSVSADLLAGYRYLKLDREVNGVKDKQDFSGVLGMLTVRIKF